MVFWHAHNAIRLIYIDCIVPRGDSAVMGEEMRGCQDLTDNMELHKLCAQIRRELPLFHDSSCVILLGRRQMALFTYYAKYPCVEKDIQVMGFPVIGQACDDYLKV